MPFHIDFVQKGTKNESNSSRSPLKYLIEFGLRFVDLNSARNRPNFLVEFEYLRRIFGLNSSRIRLKHACREKKTDDPSIGPQNEKDRVPDPRSLYII